MTFFYKKRIASTFFPTFFVESSGKNWWFQKNALSLHRF